MGRKVRSERQYLLMPPKHVSGRIKGFLLRLGDYAMHDARYTSNTQATRCRNASRRSTEIGLAAAGFLYDAALASARFERRPSRAAHSSIRHMCCALSFGRQL
jgi:hypothetical protein